MYFVAIVFVLSNFMLFVAVKTFGCIMYNAHFRFFELTLSLR